MVYLTLGYILLGIFTQATAQECGQRKATFKQTFVIGGENARHGDWPWQALFLRSSSGSSFCGGSLINNQWVVTAAHCVCGQRAQNIIVRLGETDRRISEGSEIDIRVAKIVIHRNWRKATLNYDIALVKLEKPVDFTDYIQPICVPSEEAPDGTSCYITGWGKIKHPGGMVTHLQQGLLHKQNRAECKEYNRRKIWMIPVTQQMICGAQPGTIMSGCHGDSGGPYVCKIGKRWELHGAVSWGNGRCDAKDAHTVFANVAYFKTWIDRRIRDDAESQICKDNYSYCYEYRWSCLTIKWFPSACCKSCSDLMAEIKRMNDQKSKKGNSAEEKR